MFIEKGKTNWTMIIVVALLAGAVGGGSVAYINDTIKQTQDMSQSVQVVNPQHVQPAPETNTIQQNNNPDVVVPDATAPQQ